MYSRVSVLITSSQNSFHSFTPPLISKHVEIIQIHESNWLDGEKIKCFKQFGQALTESYSQRSSEYLENNHLLKFHLYCLDII